MAKEKVLVVDDELLCSYFLCLSLEEEGYESRSAASASEAIEIGTEFKPNILITDWMLKDGQDGIDIARALFGLNPDLKIIFITGMASDAIEERVNDIKYLAIIEKPVDLKQIMKILKN